MKVQGLESCRGLSLQAVEQIPDPSQVDALRFVIKDPLEIRFGLLGVSNLQIEEGAVQSVLR